MTSDSDVDQDTITSLYSPLTGLMEEQRRGMDKRGYVYVAEDKSKPSHYKIGKTTDPEQRERQLQGAGLGKRIKIVERVQVDDMDAVEHAFHEILKPHQVEGEWFNITLNQVKPMLACVGSFGNFQRTPTPSKVEKRRGGWHEDGWKMHCEGATQAAVATRFGVTQGAVVAMKKKMRNAGRGHEEGQQLGTAAGVGRSQRATSRASFSSAIIKVLKRLGGRARAKDVLSGVESELNLSQADLKKRSNGQVVWRNNAQWAQQQLKKKGVLRSDSQWGWWELA